MSCDDLPYTGVAHIGPFLAIALILLTAGALALFLARLRRAAGAAVLVVLIAGATIALTPGSTAQASIPDCLSGQNSLTITQTSTMEGLAPGIAPVGIAGIVVNDGTDDTYVTAIGVRISSVLSAPAAVPGSCDASDYTIVGARMLVREALGPGGSTTFSGATIGFNNKTINQDLCKGAVIHLLYTAEA